MPCIFCHDIYQQPAQGHPLPRISCRIHENLTGHSGHGGYLDPSVERLRDELFCVKP